MRLRTVPPGKYRGRRVILREDFNVPLSPSEAILDDTKIRMALPTIRSFRRTAQAVIILSHLGRPAGRGKDLSLKPVARRLAKLLGTPVQFFADGPTAENVELTKNLPRGSVVLMENTRLFPGEESNSPILAKRLAALGDVFIMDAFANAHRRHASMVGITRYLPSYAGPQVVAEVKALSRATHHPRHPFVAIIGGAKVSTKIGLLRVLMQRADYVCLGGALANTVLRARGLATGASKVEERFIPQLRRLSLTSTKLKLPVDVTVSTPKKKTRASWVRAVGMVRANEVILDIGPDSTELFHNVVAKARLVVWNGPLGLFELPRYAKGTKALARVLAQSSAETIVGGGETVEAIESLRLERRFSHLSTAGGAMLEFLERGTLPALIPLIQ
jgi:phosphoglycerate kinase